MRTQTRIWCCTSGSQRRTRASSSSSRLGSSRRVVESPAALSPAPRRSTLAAHRAMRSSLRRCGSTEETCRRFSRPLHSRAHKKETTQQHHRQQQEETRSRSSSHLLLLLLLIVLELEQNGTLLLVLPNHRLLRLIVLVMVMVMVRVRVAAAAGERTGCRRLCSPTRLNPPLSSLSHQQHQHGPIVRLILSSSSSSSTSSSSSSKRVGKGLPRWGLERCSSDRGLQVSVSGCVCVCVCHHVSLLASTHMPRDTPTLVKSNFFPYVGTVCGFRHRHG
mmetsp:Transcript_50449/g.126415  ORF Transcript_50449/g.126415 Transcript_50449/m.126415 type:complete len:276 (+) Transcript_50449:127-954(+)